MTTSQQMPDRKRSVASGSPAAHLAATLDPTKQNPVTTIGTILASSPQTAARQQMRDFDRARVRSLVASGQYELTPRARR